MIDIPEGLFGVFRRDDLIEQIGRPAVRLLLRQQRLIAYSRSVLVDRRRELQPRTRAAAALLHVGRDVALTGQTAAWAHGCAAAELGVVHVLSRYHRKVRGRDGLIVHSGWFEEDDVVELNGLRSVVLDLAIAEVLCTGHRATALACADQAMAMVDPKFRDDLKSRIADRIDGRADPRGTRRATTLLALASGRTESPAESAVLLAIADAELPLPDLQVPVHDIVGRERYRLDFAWQGPKVALEYDGYEAHETRRERDESRDADLRSRGWHVVRAVAADLRDSSRLVAEIRAALAKRRYAPMGNPRV